jgi:hypothetical protein
MSDAHTATMIQTTQLTSKRQKKKHRQKPHHETTQTQIERRYFLFVHYSLKGDREWRRQGRALVVDTVRVLSRLREDIRYLIQVLSVAKDDQGQGWRGFAFIFLDPGWTEMLKGDRPMAAAELAVSLETARGIIQNGLEAEFGKKLPLNLITAAQLVQLLDTLDNQEQPRKQKNRYFKFFAGGTRQLRYDGPKVVESAIRIANIGRQVPIFRFDDDVIFQGGRSLKGDRQQEILGTQQNILRLCERYRELSIDPKINYFIFSGSYTGRTESADTETAELVDTSPAGNVINGFATRVVQVATLPEASISPVGLRDQASVSTDIAMKFLNELYRYGANPFRQVISGAGLCLSDSAILDLPPFSNMRLNIMWIDDHLKYALHHELGHFGLREPTRHSARVAGAGFKQIRYDAPPTYKDVEWHMHQYMLRLVLGCIVDSWLRKVPQLKQKLRDLPHDQFAALMNEVPACYVDEFFDVVPGGWQKGSSRKDEFKQELWTVARERLNVLVSAWSHDEFEKTFLGLFVRGKDHPRYNEFSSYFPEQMKAGFGRAVTQVSDGHRSLNTATLNLNDPTLEEALCVLLDDFVEYFELVLFWKYFVQSVRFMLNGRDRTLIWMFPHDLV